MDGWDVALIAFLVMYFLPGLIYWLKSSDNFFAKVVFLGLCVCINWTVLGWFMTMALAVDEG